MTLAQMLEAEEGRKRSAYQDHLGYWTIGVGRLIDRRKGGGLSPDEIDYLLTNDIRAKSREVFTALRRAGVVVVTVFAYGDNMSAVRDPDAPRPEPRAAAPGDSARSDTTRTPPAPPMVTAQHLTPAKARILLMVALTRTKDPLEIQRYFLRY